MRKSPLSKTRSATVIAKWQNMSPEERAARSESLRAKKQAYWASLTPEQVEEFKRKTAEGRRKSPYWNGALARSIPSSVYRKSGLDDDEIEYLMTLTPMERKAARLRQRDHGLSPIAFRDMLIAQDGKCGLCGRTMERVVVDHGHGSGSVRGLLCPHCNLALGHIETLGRDWVERAFT